MTYHEQFSNDVDSNNDVATYCQIISNVFNIQRWT